MFSQDIAKQCFNHGWTENVQRMFTEDSDNYIFFKLKFKLILNIILGILYFPSTNFYACEC